MGVVKSDAYGHGAVAVAGELQRLGAEYLGVACLDEGLQLREAGIAAPIMILGGTPLCDLPLLLQHDFTQTVYDLTQAEDFAHAAAAVGAQLRVHIKVDTGMTRLGFLCQDKAQIPSLVETISALMKNPGLAVEGLFTHLSDADADETYTRWQLAHFSALLQVLEERGIRPPICHAANSAGTLGFPDSHLDMVRVGLALYGYNPGPGDSLPRGVKPILSLKARLIAARDLPGGLHVGYGQSFVLPKKDRVGVLSIGYGDGLPRNLGEHFAFSTAGKAIPLLGRVCMDLCIVSLAAVPEADFEDEILVYGPDCTGGTGLSEAALQLGTISYELLCRISPRIPRLYETQDDTL